MTLTLHPYWHVLLLAASVIGQRRKNRGLKLSWPSSWVERCYSVTLASPGLLRSTTCVTAPVTSTPHHCHRHRHRQLPNSVSYLPFKVPGQLAVRTVSSGSPDWLAEGRWKSGPLDLCKVR